MTGSIRQAVECDSPIGSEDMHVMIRVLVVEDSIVARELLLHVLRQEPGLEVVGVAPDGEAAVAMAERLRPDIVLMDVHMPRLDGLEATRRIMERTPSPIVMVSASMHRNETDLTFASLEAGALAVAEKPRGLDHPDFERNVAQLIQTLKSMAEVKVVRRWPRQAPAPPQPPRASARRATLVAIGASTGGPKALAEILSGLPADLPATILVVQHIAAGFITGLAQWLAQKTSLSIKLADYGERTRPGTVYLAPEGGQMGVDRAGRIMMGGAVKEDGFCPSASFLFRSVAESCGSTAIGVLLTGMGQDGAAGLLHLRRAGGVTIAQDEASCVVFGMPARAIELDACDHVLPVDGIARTIRALVAGG
jgi:two-component system, chemotaxis family, protein-glutamate methylesterase/glutaminase